jgi:RNA polymerase sigma-70 factor (ECF subfamily)
MNESDVALVASAQRGDRPALEELVRRTSRLVYARLYLETGDAHQAEDLTQETYLQAVRSLPTLQAPGQFRSWLLKIADNALIDAVRNRNRRKRAEPPRAPAEMLNQIPGNGLNPAEAAQAAEERSNVLAVMRSLPDDYRQPLMLRYFGGADYETMEVQLGLSNGALRGMLHRGLKMLKDKLADG